MIPKKGMERKIAELLGEYCLCDNPGIMINKYYDHEPNCEKCNKLLRLNWSTSLDVARELKVVSDLKFMICLDIIVRGNKYPAHDRWIDGDVIRIAFATSPQWCLAWILSEHGLRWVECYSCLGTKECQGGDGCHGNSIEPCPICNGKGGEWEKV